MLRKLELLVVVASILGLIWMAAGIVVDGFWCSGCSRAVVSVRSLIALTFLAGLLAGLVAAAWAWTLTLRCVGQSTGLPEARAVPKHWYSTHYDDNDW